MGKQFQVSWCSNVLWDLGSDQSKYKGDAYQIGPDTQATIVVWHVMRREETHITRSTLSMHVTRTRPRGRPQVRWLARLQSDMRVYCINPDMATDTSDRERWSVMVKNVDTTYMVEDGNG